MNLKPILDLLNNIADEELRKDKIQIPKYICTSKRHWSNLTSTKIGEKCICGGTFELNTKRVPLWGK